MTKVGLATVSKPSAAGTLPVNVLAGQVIEHERFGIGDVIKWKGPVRTARRLSVSGMPERNNYC